MFKITAICDRCKKEETQNSKYFNERENGWKDVTIQTSQYEKKSYLFCVECQKKLGLWRVDQNSEPKVGSVADRLFDVIAEIVADQLPSD